MSEMKNVIKVGVSIGDVNGVGVEVLIDALSDSRLFDDKIIVLYGHSHYVKNYKKILNHPDFQFEVAKDSNSFKGKKLQIIELEGDPIEISCGTATAEAGAVALKSLQRAVDDLANNKIDVLVTLPINKDTIQSDEFDFPGHTEFLANIANVENPLMLLVDDNLRVGVATGHVPISEVAGKLTKELIVSKVKIFEKSLISDFNIHRPKIAILGLNPHAGDNGLIGAEESEIIIPAIKQLSEGKSLVFGPFGADGFFGTLNYNQYDGVLAMYHDQGLIPFKTLAFENGVNFTAGLPIVRTSPDHGTAYEIAGKGVASSSSFRYALFLATDIYKQRKEHRELSSNPLPLQEKKKRVY